MAAKTLVNKTTTVKNYGNNGNAYEFTQEVIQNAAGDPATNTTSMTVNLYIKGINSYTYNGFSTPKAAIYIGGTKKKEVTVGQVTRSKVKYATYKTDVQHLDDGTLNLKVKTTYEPNTTAYSFLPASYSYESSTTLTAIPRASTMTLASTSIDTLGSTTATITRRSDSFTHSIIIRYGDSNEIYELFRGSGTTATLSVPSQISTWMASKQLTSVTLPLVLTTFNGTTVIGTSAYTLTITVPEPTITLSRASVACDATNWSWTLGHTDTTVLDYSVTRLYGSTLIYTDMRRTDTFSTSKTVLNDAYEPLIMSNTYQGTATVSVTTYAKGSSTSVKTITKTYTVTIPKNTYAPTLTISSQLAARQITAYTTKSGISFLAGYDSARGTITESITGSAQIQDRSVTIEYTGISSTETTGEYSINNSTVTIDAVSAVKALPPSSSNYTVKVTYTVKDKRGTTVSKSFNVINVSGYSAPTFTDISLVRADSSGAVDPEGTYANLSATASAHSITGTTLKSITAKKDNVDQVGRSTDSNALTVTKFGGSYATTSEYSFTITATDSLDISTSQNVLLPKAAVTLSLHKNNGIGLGTVAIPQAVTVGLPLTAKNNVYIKGFLQVGTDSMSTTNDIEVKSGSGALRLEASSGNTDLKRIWAFNASSSPKAIVTVDQSNNAIFYGSLSGNASTATTATTASKLGSSNMGSTNQPIYLSGGSPTLGSKYIPISDSNVADGEYKFQNASYAPEIKDTASGIGCANKGSRYLINELLVDGIVAPKTAYSEHSMSTRSNTIQFYKYSGNSGGQWTGLTKTAYIDTSGIYHPQVSRTDTYMLAGLVGVAISATQLRVQIPVPSGYSNFTPALVSGQTTANLDYNGTDASFTFSAVAKLDMNPASVSIVLTTSGLTAYRVYGFRNGRVSITLS